MHLHVAVLVNYLMIHKTQTTKLTIRHQMSIYAY